MIQNKVAIYSYEDNFDSCLEEGLRKTGLYNKIYASDSIIIKINAIYDNSIRGTITSPDLIFSLISALREQVSNVYVVESDINLTDASYRLMSSGLDHIIAKAGGKFVNLAKSFSGKAPTTRYKPSNELKPRIFQDCDFFIDFPVMKTHWLTTVSLGIKNLYGLLPFKQKYLLHPVINDVLADLAVFYNPDLTIIDATVGMEGNGPIRGTSKEFGKLIFGNDVGATDTIGATLMGFSPLSIPHIRLTMQNRSLRSISVTGENLKASIGNFSPAINTPLTTVYRLISNHSSLNRLINSKNMFRALQHILSLFNLSRGPL